jgi:PKD repeat protein
VGGLPASSNVQNPTAITYNFAGDYNVCLTATNQWGQQTLCKNAYIHVTGPTNAPLVMTEINYRSPIIGTDSLEFIEIYNKGTAPVNMLNFAFSRGVEFTFPAFTLNPQSYLLVAKSAVWMQNIYGVQAYQWNVGSALTNQGEAIVLKDLYGYVVDSVYYLPTLPWDTMANGKGPSLELCDPESNNLLPENWRHAIEYQGVTPGGDSLYGSPAEGCGYLPVANFNVNDSTIAVGQSVIFTDASTGNVTTWYWEFERGNPETFNGQNPPPIQYNVMGSYDVSLTVTNGTGQHKKYKPGFIQVGPVGLPPEQKNGHKLAWLSTGSTTSGQNTIQFCTAGQYEVEIFTMTGIQVFRTFAGQFQPSLILPELTAGFYIIQIKDIMSEKVQIIKFLNH